MIVSFNEKAFFNGEIDFLFYFCSEKRLATSLVKLSAVSTIIIGNSSEDFSNPTAI
jgi:hypothetical protein